MTDKTILEYFGERIGYTEDDMARFTPDDPRVRTMERLAETFPKYSIVAEVITARHCNSGYQAGDRFVLDLDGNFVPRDCPRKMCVYLVSQLVGPVALINERLSEGLDPNQFHFMRNVRCLDVGVECNGYGEVMMGVRVAAR